MGKELLKRYDLFFENNASEKLIEARKKYSQNQYLRINISKSTKIEIENFLKKNRIKYSNSFLPNSIKIEKSFFNISAAPENILGKYYLQDIASQLPVNLIDFIKLKNQYSTLNDNSILSILDMAASPGSKTTQIADILTHHNIKYKITAIEPEKKRLLKLINNIQKQGFENITIINTIGENFNQNEKYDIILLDAPCSGNMIDDKDWLEKRNLNGIEEKSSLQKKLLENASKLLKDEGLLIYSTCSLEPEENELNILYAEKNLKLISIKQNILKFQFETNPIKLIKDKNILEKIKNQNSLRLMSYISQKKILFLYLLKKTKK